jgi:hypothetical protein
MGGTSLTRAATPLREASVFIQYKGCFRQLFGICPEPPKAILLCVYLSSQMNVQVANMLRDVRQEYPGSNAKANNAAPAGMTTYSLPSSRWVTATE